MRTDHYFDSLGEGKIRYCKWLPEGEVKAVVQILHGIAEHVERYDDFANYLNSQGIAVVAEDHMGHGKSMVTQGYFAGGWFTAEADSYRLLEMAQAEFPEVPYVLFGHSMGSFMARTILCQYPDCGISAAIICGTGWQPTAALPAMIKMVELVCKVTGETRPSEPLQGIVFGSYNKRVEHPRTPFDWLTRDKEIVDAYIAHPLCGFTASCGLLREMVRSFRYIQDPANLGAMRKDLPVFFIAGGDDPVGNYGKGIHQSADAFKKAGMEDVSVKIYPLGRHEILNEINKEEVFADVVSWVEKRLEKQE